MNTHTFYSGGQLYNYSGAFLLGGAAYLLVLMWTIFKINETKDTIVFDKKFNTNRDSVITGDREVQIIREKHKQFADNKHINPVKLLFSLDNLKDIVETCCKPRGNYVRLQIWLLFLSMSCYLLAHIGPMIFMYQFSQKVYEWDSGTYSNATAIASIATALGTMTIAPILLKVCPIL